DYYCSSFASSSTWVF
nr:immunoglobulin light chain junction region [Macaca mulatta]MOV73646.1 immunoglobulin light chain junction region [Macaca mulatta]MOV73695.1 immunoglobulin light chain junction region [Macaca mulatta]MOV73751.1 immunoglobulin light chain junction region [Macaca mulatta]MOV74190.1 immunoglobulin light chain junction region [Macaca mulatta]